MRKITHFPLERLNPDRSVVLAAQGIGPGVEPPRRIIELYERARDIFFELAQPVGIVAPVSIEGFQEIYRGNGKNEKNTPLEHIFPRARSLALFAFTLGKKISDKIDRLFASNEFAPGAMLDAVASTAAEKAAGIAEEDFSKFLSGTQRVGDSAGVILYSPGYCGWHISGQEKLFEFLHPQEIGISLNPSYLMTPLKSISGVLAAGEKEIHYFKDDFPFCTRCRDRSCRKRIKSLQKQRQREDIHLHPTTLHTEDKNGYLKPNFHPSAAGG